MDELKNNKVFWALLVVTALNIGSLLLGKVVIDKAADRVIQRLQKEYSPSPYGPGFDPDKTNPDALRSSKVFFNLHKESKSKVFHDEAERPIQDAVQTGDVWREEWERSRTSNPSR